MHCLNFGFLAKDDYMGLKWFLTFSGWWWHSVYGNKEMLCGIVSFCKSKLSPRALMAR